MLKQQIKVHCVTWPHLSHPIIFTLAAQTWMSVCYMAVRHTVLEAMTCKHLKVTCAIPWPRASTRLAPSSASAMLVTMETGGNAFPTTFTAWGNLWWKVSATISFSRIKKFANQNGKHFFFLCVYNLLSLSLSRQFLKFLSRKSYLCFQAECKTYFIDYLDCACQALCARHCQSQM